MEKGSEMIGAMFGVPVLCVLALVHLYWAFGGRRAVTVAASAHSGARGVRPSRAALVGIAGAFGAAAAVVAMRAGWIDLWRDPPSVRIAAGMVALAFSLRAIGDFRYVGAFKRNGNASVFGFVDTLLCCPLCIALSVAAISPV